MGLKISSKIRQKPENNRLKIRFIKGLVISLMYETIQVITGAFNLLP
jgi:hypothetical protein